MDIYDIDGGDVRVIGLPQESDEDAFMMAMTLARVAENTVIVSKKARREDEYEKIATVYIDGSIEVERKQQGWRVVC